MIDGFLFLSDYLDLFMVIGYLFLLISTVVLIMITQYQVKEVAHLVQQVEYWRNQALRKNSLLRTGKGV